jgi:hypothetical protein
MTHPILREGLAVLKKKPIDKSRLMEVDQKALDTAEFIEQIEMFGSQWNVFEDAREWRWTQEAEALNTEVRIEEDEMLLPDEEPAEDQLTGAL